MADDFDSQTAVKNAIAGALAGDATLQATIGSPARVYDNVAVQDATFPYIVIGNVFGQAEDTKSEDGFQQDVDLNFLSRGPGRTQLNSMMARAAVLLHEASPSVSGHTLVFLRLQTSLTFMEEDGYTHHGVQTYRVETQPT